MTSSVTSPDILNSLIYANIVLFILSAITEKFTQLIRFYPRPFRWIGIIGCALFYIPIVRGAFYDPRLALFNIIFLLLFNTAVVLVLLANDALVTESEMKLMKRMSRFFSAFNNIKKGGTGDRSITASKAQEGQKEKEITALSFIVGFIISYLFNANLFGLFKPSLQLGWGDVAPFAASPWYALNPAYFDEGIFQIIGFMLTAFFLSFGSKFFHDLLDTLLQTKNLKRKLNDTNTFDVNTVQQFDDYLSLTDTDLVNLAISQNEGLLKGKFKNIQFLNDSMAVVNGMRKDVVGIYLDDDNTSGIPAQVPAKLPFGKTVFVPTSIITGAGLGKVTAGMDGDVANALSSSYTGSGCCVVQDQPNVYLVTNCHVMTEGNLKCPLFNTGGEDVLYETGNIGQWYYGAINRQNDLALVRLADPDTFIRENDIKSFKGLREITKDDHLQLRVTARAQKCKTNSDAYIIDVVKNKTGILYKYGFSMIFDELILIGSTPDSQTCKPVSTYGDSGGSVYDQDNNLIGILTGSNERFSFVLPLKDVFKNLQLNLK